MVMTSRIKKVLMVQPKSAGGNFEYALILRQGLPVLAGALKQWNERPDAPFFYEPWIWFEERMGPLDPDKDLNGFDILMVTALINEVPRGYQIAREAKLSHPGIVTIGGGPHMSPLHKEAFREGKFDAIVEREGEDIIGQLCDVFMANKAGTREQFLRNVQGIFFGTGDGVESFSRGKKVIPADMVELPDYASILGLSRGTPVLGGSMETVRGCTENCTYCEVIKQFLGYRTVEPEIQLKRIEQIQQLVADGLIHNSDKHGCSVFLTDDLHVPPLRAQKFRDFRLARLREWKGKTEELNFTAQVRAEVGQDPEIMDAMLEAGIKMLYLGLESDNDANLLAVGKRQEADQVKEDLVTLRKAGFKLVGMTIIGLPFDTEDSIMSLAKWVTELTDHQTMNWLTPLPATSNWPELVPLDETGNVLAIDEEGNVNPEYGTRPYHLYTGEQLVTQDGRWTMQESYELGRRYYEKLKPIDDLYTRIFSMSIQRNARKWAQEVASYFHGIPELASMAAQIEQVLSRPAAPQLSELWEHVSGATSQFMTNTRIVRALNALRSYQVLFGYARA